MTWYYVQDKNSPREAWVIEARKWCEMKIHLKSQPGPGVVVQTCDHSEEAKHCLKIPHSGQKSEQQDYGEHWLFTPPLKCKALQI